MVSELSDSATMTSNNQRISKLESQFHDRTTVIQQIQTQLQHSATLQQGFNAKLEQFTKKIELLMNAREPDFSTTSKSDTEHDRRVLICGYTEEEDCLCEATDSLNSDYDDEEEVHESLTEKLENSSLPIYPVCAQSAHDKVNSLPKNEFSSLSLTKNTVIGVIDAYKEDFHVASKAFNERPKSNTFSWNVLIAGYNQWEDCLCVTTSQYQPMYNDSGGEIGNSQLMDWSKDEELLKLINSSAQGPDGSTSEEAAKEVVGQTKISKVEYDRITSTEVYRSIYLSIKANNFVDHEDIQATIGDLSSSNNQVCDQLIHDKPTIPIAISRVNQVDAGRLDIEMFAMLKEQLVKVFPLMKPGMLFQYEPELDTFLEFLIWRFSIWVDKPTLMNLRYRDEWVMENRGEVRTSLEGPELTFAQRVWYCVATVGVQYIWASLQSFPAFRRWGDSEQRSMARRAWYLIQRIEGFYKATAILGTYELSAVVIDEVESFVAIFDPGGSIISTSSYFRLDHNSHVFNSLIFMLTEMDVMCCYNSVHCLSELGLMGCLRENFTEIIDAKSSAAFFVQKLFIEMSRWNHIVWKTVKSGYCGKAYVNIFDPGGEEFHDIWFEAPKVLSFCSLGCSFRYTGYAQCGKARKSMVMEFLLMTHPLDCPICDQDGECNLQDQSMAFGSDPGLVVGCQTAVNKSFICYGLKLRAICVLNINTALRSLLKGLAQRVTYMVFFAEDVHLLASASVDGRVYVWKITEGSDKEEKAQITRKIVIAIHILGEGESVHPWVCCHCHKQEVLVVGIGKTVLQIVTTKVGKGEVYLAEEPLKCPVDKMIDGVQFVSNYDGEVTDLSMCQWIWASTSEEGWLLPIDADSEHCTQILELKSCAGPCVEDVFFKQVMAFSQDVLLLLANVKKNATYAVHLDYGPNPATTRMDYIAGFTVTMPILIFTGSSDLLSIGEQIVQVYCVQMQAIQQYALDLSQCLPPPLENVFERVFVVLRRWK